MKLVTQTETTQRMFSELEAVKLLADAGFDGIDFSMFDTDSDKYTLNAPDYLARAGELKKYAQSLGVTFEQSHAPFPPFRKDNEEYNKKVMPKVERALEISAELGIKVCVVHPCAVGENQFDINIKYYNSLIPVIKGTGLKIAVENMWGRDPETKKIISNICSVSEDFNRYVDALDPEYFTACLDLGHCGLVGSDAETMIREMGAKRITSLHIHDNDYLHDSHTVPYLMDMKWDGILRALGEIGYSGNFTYEADNFLKGFPKEVFPTCLKFMADLGRYMMGEIEKYKGIAK